MKLKLFFIIPLSGLLGLSAITSANTDIEKTLEDTLKNRKVQLGLEITGGVLAGTGVGVGLYKLNQMNALTELQYKYYQVRLEYYQNRENTMANQKDSYTFDEQTNVRNKVLEYRRKVYRTEKRLSQLEQKRDAALKAEETEPLLPAENFSSEVKELTTVSDRFSALTEDQVNTLTNKGYSIVDGKLINIETGEELSDEAAEDILDTL